MPVWVFFSFFLRFSGAPRGRYGGCDILVVIGSPPIATQSSNARPEYALQFPLARSLHIAHRIHQKWREWWLANWWVSLVELGAVITISHGRYKLFMANGAYEICIDCGRWCWLICHCRVKSPEHEQSAIKIWNLLRCVRIEQKCARREEWEEKERNVFCWRTEIMRTWLVASPSAPQINSSAHVPIDICLLMEFFVVVGVVGQSLFSAPRATHLMNIRCWYTRATTSKLYYYWICIFDLVAQPLHTDPLLCSVCRMLAFVVGKICVASR